MHYRKNAHRPQQNLRIGGGAISTFNPIWLLAAGLQRGERHMEQR